MFCNERQGIGFEKADSIALSLDTPLDSLDRLQAGIKYILNFNAFNNGHTYLPYDKLKEASEALLGVEGLRITEALTSLAASKDIVITKSENGHDVSLNDIEKLICAVEESDEIKYSNEQRRAITEALTNSLYVLTGGPGTGKTTIIRAIIRIFNTLGLTFCLAAPTGRAAKRMTESTLYEARTIHRLLEYEFRQESDEASFARDDTNPLAQ